MKRSLLVTSCVLLLIVAIWAGRAELSSSGEERSAAASRHRIPNIVFIVADTLRADHLPFYGYSRNTAPFLADLASRSVVFERAFAASSWTAPAMASIFTSRRPSQHGVITGYSIFEDLNRRGAEITLNPLPGSLRVLGEYFKDSGYTLFGLADNLNIGDTLGFTRGFARFKTFRNKGANVLVNRAKRWQPIIEGAAPYVLYLHFMDPHWPYLERKPWFEPAADEKQRMKNAYDSEIAFMDAQIKELFEAFGWGDETVVIFLSDHGEEFWEHGHRGHGKALYTESIHVPFLLKLPKIAASRVRSEVSPIDLLPTLSDYLGLPPDEHWQGKSLRPFITDESRLQVPEVWSELLFAPAIPLTPSRSIIAESYQLIESGRESPFQYELFDLNRDFAETQNVFGSEPDIARHLNELLSRGNSGKTPEAQSVTVPLDKKEIENLKTLGYLH